MNTRHFALLLAIATFSGCRHAAQDAPNATGDLLVRVAPIKPQRETLIRYTEQPGQIAALEETPIYAKVTGYVRQVHVDIGDRVGGPVIEEGKIVKPGQTLLEIDVPELEKELAQRQAAVEQVAAEVKQAKAAIKVAQAMRTSAEADVNEAKAAVDRAVADRERAQSEFDRISDLSSRQAVTTKLVDEAKNALSSATAATKEVTAKIQSAEARLNEADALIEKAEADAEAMAARQKVAAAEEQRVAKLLSFATISAPFSGVIAARHVDTGHLVSGTTQSKQPLLVVVRPETVRIFVDVPETDAVFVEPGAEATLRIGSPAGQSFAGKVTRTTWVLNQATRTLRTEIDVPNDSGRLRPGMYATARLKVAERPDVLIIPKTAITSAAGQSHVWIVDESGVLKKQAIQTGLEAEGKVEVVSGLSEGESLIGVNPSAFREGQKVEIAPPPGK
jgi:RND family efflux transporter MFP subunit